MSHVNYRERLTANANDFDAIVSEILAENASLRVLSNRTALIEATIKACRDAAEPHLTATPIKESIARLTPDSVLAKIKEAL
jgi:hypothetical protein